jgi:signal recognition particle GTPase
MGFLSSLLGHLGMSHAQSVDWEELEAALYQSDLGRETVASIMTRLQENKGSLSETTILKAARQ